MKAKPYKILQSFNLPGTITLQDGRVIEQGIRIGPGEESLLQYLSKSLFKKLTSDGLIGVPGAEADKDNSEGMEYSENFLRGLISPGAINRAAKLLTEKCFNIENLEILKAKSEEVMSSGITSPVLKLLYEEIISQLYDLKIVQNEASSGKVTSET